MKVVDLIDIVGNSDAVLNGLRDLLDREERRHSYDIVAKVCEKVSNGKLRNAITYAVEYLGEWEDVDEQLPKTSCGLFSDLILELDSYYNDLRYRKRTLKEIRELKEKRSKTANVDEVVKLSEEIEVAELFCNFVKEETKLEEELIVWCKKWWNKTTTNVV